jgi:predicted transcriptional regulator
MSGHIGSHHFPRSPASLLKDEAEVLAALQNEPQSTADLVMVCNMGRAAVQIHLQHLLGSGRIEREMAISSYGGKPHQVRTGRYRAVVRIDSSDTKRTELRAVA